MELFGESGPGIGAGGILWLGLGLRGLELANLRLRAVGGWGLSLGQNLGNLLQLPPWTQKPRRLEYH